MQIGDKVDVTVFLGSGESSKGRCRRGTVVEVYEHHAVVECVAGYRVCVNEARRGEAWRSGAKVESKVEARVEAKVEAEVEARVGGTVEKGVYRRDGRGMRAREG